MYDKQQIWECHCSRHELLSGKHAKLLKPWPWPFQSYIMLVYQGVVHRQFMKMISIYTCIEQYSLDHANLYIYVYVYIYIHLCSCTYIYITVKLHYFTQHMGMDQHFPDPDRRLECLCLVLTIQLMGCPNVPDLDPGPYPYYHIIVIIYYFTSLLLLSLFLFLWWLLLLLQFHIITQL